MNSYLKEMAEHGYRPDTIGRFHMTMIPYLIRRAAPATDDLVVDIGAGQGHGLIPLYKAGYRNLVAVDREETNFLFFQRVYGIGTVSCDIEKERIALPDCSANVILCTHLIEHLAKPDNLLREALRILKPGGSLFLVT